MRMGSPSEITKELVGSIQNDLRRVHQPPSEPCIFRVPRRLRKANEDAYTPQVVSIGPYHRGTSSLQAMEDTKLRYLSDFLNRNHDNSLEHYVEDLISLEESVRQCYGETIIIDGSKEFVKMMLLDGCFIVELFFKASRGYNVIKDMVEGDLLLLENQLPFFVLEHLFRLVTTWEDSFLPLTLHFFQIHSGIRRDSHEPKHFVDLILQCYASPTPRNTTTLPLPLPLPVAEVSKVGVTWKPIPNATELHKAGVKFNKGKGNRFLDLKFSNGVFEIPALMVEDRTELLLRNLVAFEQCSRNEEFITQYSVLMDFLINSPDDVALLRRYGIIENWLGDNEPVSQIFNKICDGVIPKSNKYHFFQLCEDVNAYYKTPWHTFRAL